jgi:hypothetical protein
MPAGLEVADVFHRHGEAYRCAHDGHLGRVERRVMSAIELCRTAALGGHAECCSACGFVRYAYNSCRNRHCPKCQGQARAEWLAARQAELLPVPYFRVVFTLPAPVAEIAFQNKRTVYAILFRTAAETLRKIAADRRHLGAEIGLIARVTHLGPEPAPSSHVHCIVPGGGPSLDGMGWVACRPGFFLPVRVSRLFRRLFLDALRAAFKASEIGFSGALADLAEPAAFACRLRELRRVEWVVNAKPPFGGPAQVLAYLGRYTHRVAIANSRLVRLTDTEVAFRWKDYRHHGKSMVMTPSADEFIRRFLPDGFHRIRHYGFIANGHRAEKLALCRKLIDTSPATTAPPPVHGAASTLPGHCCPCCGGPMIFLATLPPLESRQSSFWHDTS